MYRYTLGILILSIICISSLCYGADNTNSVIGQIITNSGTTIITKDISRVTEAPEHYGIILCGLQGDLTSSATIYFYGALQSYLVQSDGTNNSYSISGMDGYKSLQGIAGIGDEYTVSSSSPTILIVNVIPGSKVGYVLSGTIRRDGK